MEHSFIAYPFCAQIANAQQTPIPLADKKNFQIHLKTLLQEIKKREKKQKYSLIFIANPNNPTGSYLPKREMEAFLQEMTSCTKTICVVDEAYNEFVRADPSPSLIDLLPQHKNLLLLRTFSKAYGLAALRLGVLLSSPKAPEVIENFHRVRNPFNVNQMAILAALEALKDKEHLRQSQEQVWRGLDFFYTSLKRLGLHYIPSQGNFVLFQAPSAASSVAPSVASSVAPSAASSVAPSATSFATSPVTSPVTSSATLSAEKIHALLLKKGILLRPPQILWTP